MQDGGEQSGCLSSDVRHSVEIVRNRRLKFPKKQAQGPSIARSSKNGSPEEIRIKPERYRLSSWTGVSEDAWLLIRTLRSG